MALSPVSVVVAIKDQLSSDLGGETVILHMGAGVYFGLDDVGGRVWALLQEPCSVAALCAAIQAEYDVDADHCARALLTLLAEMADAGLIEEVEGPAA